MNLAVYELKRGSIRPGSPSNYVIVQFKSTIYPQYPHSNGPHYIIYDIQNFLAM